MKNWKCALVAVVVLAFSGVALAQPSIGVYFDEEGTSLYHTGPLAPEMNHGYIIVKDAEMMLGGAAFAVDMDPDLMVANVTWAEGMVVGDLAGVEIGLYNVVPVFDDAIALIGTIDMFTFDAVANAELAVVAHPNYDAPKVADMASLQADAEGLTSILNTRSTPTLRVYFDEEGTETAAERNGGLGEVHSAYIMVREAEMMVGGAAFKLVMDPLIMLGNAQYASGFVIGSVTSGVEMGLYEYLPVFGTAPGLLVSMDLITFDNLMDHAELTIVAHDNYDWPMVADNNALQHPSDGLTSYLTIAVPSEQKSWGDVKSLYNQ